MSDPDAPAEEGTPDVHTGAPLDAPDRTGTWVQHVGRVAAVLDVDAHLHIWEPNRSGDRIDCDLTDHIALLVGLGIGGRPAPQPHWSDSDGTTVIVSLDLGSRGRLTVDGHEASHEAATALAAAGFLHLLRDATAQHDGPDRPSGEPQPDPDPGD